MKGLGRMPGLSQVWSPGFPRTFQNPAQHLITQDQLQIGNSPEQLHLLQRRQQINMGIAQLEHLRSRPDLSGRQKAAYERQMATQIRNEILNLSTFESKSPQIRRVSKISRPVKPHITEMTSMLKSLKSWDNGLYHVQKFTPSQLARFEVTDKAGKLSSLGGVSFNTTTLAPGHNAFIYVLSPQGKIFAHPPYETTVHHSSFLSGEPVAAAGEIQTNSRGHVTMVNNKSGHYRGNAKSLVQMVLELNARGAFAREAVVDFMGLGTVKAASLVRYLSPNLSNEQVILLVQMLPKVRPFK